MSDTPNNLATYIWPLADLLRGDFKQSQYGRVILPFTLLRRLECVLEATKADVLAEADKVATMSLARRGDRKDAAAGVYGANASGKSTLLQALGALADLVRNSAKTTDPFAPIQQIEPFRLDQKAANEPGLHPLN